MDDLLSLPRAARAMGVTQAWLREQSDTGHVPHLRAGNRYLYSASALREALAVMASRTRQEVPHD